MARRSKDQPQVDWESVYADYSKGDSSIREIARRHGISPTAINNKIARDHWVIGGSYPDDPQSEEPDTDETVELPKVKPQRTSAVLKRAKNLAQRLLSEIENTTAHHDEIAAIIMKTESDLLRRKAALKAISTGERAKNLKDIVTTLNMIDKPPAAAKTAADKPAGKKEQRQEAAQSSATTGLFAVPKLVSNNG